MKTKIISTILVLIILFPTITLAQSGSDLLKGVSSTPALDKMTDPLGLGKISIPTVPKTEPLPSKLDIGKDFGGEEVTKPSLDPAKKPPDGLGLKIYTDVEKKAIEVAEKDAAEKEADKQAACATASKEKYGREMDCAAYDAEVEAGIKADCMKPTKNVPEGFKSCEEKYEAEKNRQGSGFKFNLNALALTSGGEKQGKAIFKNEDYAKYGVVVGTLLRVTDILIMLIGSLAMITLIIAGIFMITNHGDEAWVTKGKTMMLYSILGILFALLSFAFVNVIQSALA